MDRQAARDAIDRQDAEGLDRALDGDWHAQEDVEFLHSAAGVLMAGRRWEKAAAVLDRLAEEDAGGRMKRNLCRNLAAMQEHRPGIYEQLMSSGVDNRYSVVASATGHPTVLCRKGDKQVGLSPNHRPLEGLAGVIGSLRAPYAAGEAMALLGVGDGYFLNHAAKNPPTLLLGGQQALYVLEPDVHGLLACLMIHDLSGENGPIEQKRFQWFVGEDWAESLRRRLLGDGMLPLPGFNVSLGIHAPEMVGGVMEANRAVVEAYDDLNTKVKAAYEGFAWADVANRLMGNQGDCIKPRVGLVTTKFSTVLQYSTADVAEALEGMGFEVRIIIEPSAYHRLSKIAIRRMLAEFRPDLVMQIDHHRQEYGDLYPPQLLFVCWGQDHLPNLKSIAVGKKWTSADFLLTDAVPTYVNAYGYPRRQCIALPKLTRDEMEDVEPSADAPVISFVSNASHDPRRLLEQKLDELRPAPALQELVGECGRRILDVYEKGECVPTFVAVRECVQAAQREMGLAVGAREMEHYANWLSHPFNDALYRQQALIWAGEAADELSLSMGLYGKGWESHPTLGKYARGPVAYGRELAQLTRGSRINLQVVPFPCVHQRLLDGVMAGGFFLIREHPVDRAMPALLDFLHQNGMDSALHSRDALARLSGADQERFVHLAEAVAACTKTSELDDPVEMARCFEEARIISPGEQIVPGFDEVAFHSARALREKIERFLNDPKAAERIVRQQAGSIRRRFTYPAGMRRVLDRVGRLLSESVIKQEGLAA
jgi:hypothetical protein